MTIYRLNKNLGLIDFKYPMVKQQVYMKMSGNPPVCEVGKFNFYLRVISYIIVQIAGILIGGYIIYISVKSF